MLHGMAGAVVTSCSTAPSKVGSLKSAESCHDQMDLKRHLPPGEGGADRSA